MLERLRRFLAYDATDRGRSGERNRAHLGMLDHRRAYLAAKAGDDVDYAGGNSAIGQRLHKVERRQRRVLRRLDHRGVAGDQRGEQLPRRNRHGKVPRRDHGADAQRLANRHGEFVGQLRRHGRAEQATAFAGGVVAAIDRLLHVAARLLDHLAHLAGHLLRVLFFAGDQDLRRLVQHFGTARRGDQAPLLERLFGGVHGQVDILLVGFLEDADDLAGVGRVQVLEGAAGAALHPLAADKILIGFRLAAAADARCLLFHRSHDYDCLLR